MIFDELRCFNLILWYNLLIFTIRDYLKIYIRNFELFVVFYFRSAVFN